MSGAKWLDELLGPAVVALAIPLYDHRNIVKRNALTIFFSVIVGAIVGMVSGIMLGMISRINIELIFSMAPKSVTTPIAMEISEIVGGAPALAAVYVMVAGISGAMFGPYLMKVFNIKHSISKGIGFGTASHGIGTARALEIGDVEGALSSISMTLSAVITSFLCPIILSFFL
jgi:predicted murein hydrolase (TIGR00659 family)